MRKPIPYKQRHAIASRDEWICQLCKRSVLPNLNWHIDHIQPVRIGGTNDPNNLRLLCEQCNMGRPKTIDHCITFLCEFFSSSETISADEYCARLRLLYKASDDGYDAHDLFVIAMSARQQWVALEKYLLNAD